MAESHCLAICSTPESVRSDIDTSTGTEKPCWNCGATLLVSPATMRLSSSQDQQVVFSCNDCSLPIVQMGGLKVFRKGAWDDRPETKAKLLALGFEEREF